jgi:predicted amidohydrolase YtcJ
MGASTADLILHNANVVTLCSNYAKSRLVAIKNSKILSVSPNDALNDFRGAGTRLIDCQGKTIFPGFHDAHCHFVAFAESLLTLDLGPAIVNSIADIKDRVHESARNLPAGSWIRASGYNEFYLAEGRHPTRWDLDEATTSHPVKLTHRTGHANVLNSLALRFAGITADTPEPSGGMIERDLETGEPSGLLYGMNALLSKVVPPLADSHLLQGIKLANERLLSLGITSFQDTSPHNDFRRWEMFRQWKEQGHLKPRVNMMLGTEAISELRERNFMARDGDDQLRLGAIKIILDETRGQVNPPQAELNEQVLTIHQAGFQVALHAVSETTVEAAYSALHFALKAAPRQDHRHRIEHCSVCTSTMAKKLASLGVVVVTQPAFIYYGGERYLKTVPEQQLRHLYPLASLTKAGVRIAASSDFPVIPPDPLIGIYAAIFRLAKTGQSLTPRERVSASQAIKMYTECAAYACFEEDIKGTIVPGKLADIVVLNSDPSEIDADKINKPAIEMTIIGGEIVHARDDNILIEPGIRLE